MKTVGIMVILIPGVRMTVAMEAWFVAIVVVQYST
jgi:hypothetical protein